MSESPSKVNHGHTMVNVTVNVDKDVAVSVITEVLKNPDVASALGSEGVQTVLSNWIRK